MVHTGAALVKPMTPLALPDHLRPAGGMAERRKMVMVDGAKDVVSQPK